MITIRDLRTKTDFDSFIETEKESLHVIKFGAEWCQPCKLLETRLKNLDPEKVNGVLFGEVDICDDETEALSYEFGISNIPVMLFIVNGEVKETTRGSISTNDIYGIIERVKG